MWYFLLMMVVLPCQFYLVLTKSISFGHKYGIWFSSSHRVLDDSDTGIGGPVMSWPKPNVTSAKGIQCVLAIRDG